MRKGVVACCRVRNCDGGQRVKYDADKCFEEKHAHRQGSRIG